MFYMNTNEDGDAAKGKITVKGIRALGRYHTLGSCERFDCLALACALGKQINYKSG